MPGRAYSANSEYRYGFNGQEKSDEIYGEGNAYDFGARIQDPRLGRFLSVDPIFSEYESMSPYCYAANSPLKFIDKYGEGPETTVITNLGKVNVELSNYTEKDLIHELEKKNPNPFRVSGASKVWSISKTLTKCFSLIGAIFSPMQNPTRCCSNDMCGKLGNGCTWRKLQDINMGYGHIEILTSDPSTLPNWYVQDVRQRMIEGKASVNEQRYRDELVKRGILSSRFGEAQVFNKPSSSIVLGANLERAGYVRPAVKYATAAHHIVEGTDSRADNARKILAREKIDINDADNGVFLETNYHNSLHTDEYRRKVYDRINGAQPGKVREELRKIAIDLKNKSF